MTTVLVLLSPFLVAMVVMLFAVLIALLLHWFDD